MVKKILSLIIVTLFVSACARHGSSLFFYRDHESYRKAEPGKALKLPTGVDANNFVDQYPVPGQVNNQGDINIMPPTLNKQS